MIGYYNDETSFPHKLLLTDRQFSNLLKAFVNNSSANWKKKSKTQLYKIVQPRGFPGRLLGPLLKTGFLLIKYVLIPLAECGFIPWGSTGSSIHNRCRYSLKKSWIWNNNIDMIKLRKERYHENYERPRRI